MSLTKARRAETNMSNRGALGGSPRSRSRRTGGTQRFGTSGNIPHGLIDETNCLCMAIYRRLLPQTDLQLAVLGRRKVLARSRHSRRLHQMRWTLHRGLFRCCFRLEPRPGLPCSFRPFFRGDIPPCLRSRRADRNSLEEPAEKQQWAGACWVDPAGLLIAKIIHCYTLQWRRLERFHPLAKAQGNSRFKKCLREPL